MPEEFWTPERNQRYLNLKCNCSATHCNWTLYYASFEQQTWKWQLQRPDGKQESAGFAGDGAEADLIKDFH